MDMYEELTVITLKEYQCQSAVKGFHVYKEIWKPVEGEVLDNRMEPEKTSTQFA